MIVHAKSFQGNLSCKISFIRCLDHPFYLTTRGHTYHRNKTDTYKVRKSIIFHKSCKNAYKIGKVYQNESEMFSRDKTI